MQAMPQQEDAKEKMNQEHGFEIGARVIVLTAAPEGTIEEARCGESDIEYLVRYWDAAGLAQERYCKVEDLRRAEAEEVIAQRAHEEYCNAERGKYDKYADVEGLAWVMREAPCGRCTCAAHEGTTVPAEYYRPGHKKDAIRHRVGAWNFCNLTAVDRWDR